MYKFSYIIIYVSPPFNCCNNRTKIIKEAIKTAEGRIREAEVQRVHNGGSVVNRTDAPSSGPKTSPHLEATKAYLGIK